MCVIVPAVSTVASTKIFVAPVGETKQLTIYSNAVMLKDGKPAAMILPVPAGEIQFIDVNNELFKYLDSIIRRKEHFEGMMRSKSIALAPTEFLKVISVGNYFVSVATSLEDLDKINPEVFTLSCDEELKKMFEKEYKANFHYIVCVMKENSTFHPLGYVHERMQKMFIPTMHYHGHMETNPDWDHTIFIGNIDHYNRQFDNGERIIEYQEKLMYNSRIFANFDKLCELQIELKNLARVDIYKTYDENRDFYVKAF